MLRADPMKKALLLFPLLALTGCTLFEPPLTRQEVLDIYRNQCLDYGFQGCTPEFAKCVQDLDYQAEKLALERRKAQALEAQTMDRQRPGNLRPNAYPRF